MHVCDSKGRAGAGQALVQFAVDAANTQMEFALKFFVRGDAFQQEAVHYQDVSSPFRTLLPPCRSIVANSDGLFVDGFGRAMPPCIVVERGESLDMWMQRSKQGIDPFTCMQVLVTCWIISIHPYVHAMHRCTPNTRRNAPSIVHARADLVPCVRVPR